MAQAAVGSRSRSTGDGVGDAGAGRIGDLVARVRSKNAGPFWVTVDVFCGSPEAFQIISTELHTDAVAKLYRQPVDSIRRFDIQDLHVVKFSFPRPVVQGNRLDRDMHGAQWAVLLAEHRL